MKEINFKEVVTDPKSHCLCVMESQPEYKTFDSKSSTLFIMPVFLNLF